MRAEERTDADGQNCDDSDTIDVFELKTEHRKTLEMSDSMPIKDKVTAPLVSLSKSSTSKKYYNFLSLWGSGPQA